MAGKIKSEQIATGFNLVTTAEKTVLSNTTNINSGDQIISDATISTTDITTNNVSTSKHGFAPKGSGSSTEFLNGNGSWATPAGGSSLETAGSTSVGALQYNGTTKTIGQLDGGTVAPTDTTKRLNFNGIFYATQTYIAQYNDYAEFFKKDEKCVAGNIIAIDNSNFILARGYANKKAIGVFSDTFAQCVGGDGEESDCFNYTPIGMAGRVDVLIDGLIKEGEYVIVSNKPGIGVRTKEIIPGAILGMALEDKETIGIAKISMFIMRL